MRFWGYLCVLLCLSTLYTGCSHTGSRNKAIANQEQVTLADSILSYFQQEQFDKIVSHFDDNMKLALNKEQLAVVWAQLNTQIGTYTKSEFYDAGKIDSVGDRVVYQCHFGSQKLYFQLVLGKDDQIAGLFFKTQSD